MKVSQNTKHAELNVETDARTAAGKLSSINNTASAGILPVRNMLDEYSGSYDVLPQQRAQVLPTKNKAMSDDVIVYGVPYSKVSNDSGGKTVTIG